MELIRMIAFGLWWFSFGFTARRFIEWIIKKRSFKDEKKNMWVINRN